MKKESIIYIDDRGWKYQVQPGIGGNTYKARYQKPDSRKWTCCPRLPWRGTSEEAQADLNLTARKKAWICCCLVSAGALSHIIGSGKPEGRYFAADRDRWIAVDNRSGDVWTEEFLTVDAALFWLANLREDE